MKREDAEAIRSVMSQMPRAGSASVGSPPSPRDIYTLPAHASAIDPDVALVIGNRGMGKTFWASALFDPSVRAALITEFSTARGAALQTVSAYFGFADREGVVGVSSDAIAQLSHLDPEVLWRAVIIYVLNDLDSTKLSLAECGRLVAESSEEARVLLRRYDVELQSRGTPSFFSILIN